MDTLTKWYPGDSAIQLILIVTATVIAISITALAVAACFRRNPALRHLVLLTGLVSVLGCPLLATALRTAGVSFFELPVWRSQVVISEARPSADRLAEAEPHDVAGAEPGWRDERSEPAGAPQPIDSIHHADSAGDQVAEESSAASSPAAAVTTLGLVIWAMVSCLLLLGAARAWHRLGEIRRSLQFDQLSAHQALLQKVARLAKARRIPQLASSYSVKTPITMGVLRPVIVLPTDLIQQISQVQMRDILAHEIAHCVRGDQLVVLAATLARILFWPTLVIHFLDKYLARAREEVCDNYALVDRDRLSYAETLLMIAEWSCGAKPPPATAGILHWRGKLEHRVSGIIDQRRSKMKAVRTIAASVVMVAFSLATISLCGMTLAAESRPAVIEGQPAATDKRQKSVQQMIAGLRKTEARIRNLSVTTRYVKLQKDFLPVDKPVRMELVTQAIIDSAGRSWSDTVGEQVNIEPNGKDVRIYKGHWRYTFDGQVARAMQGSDGDDKFHFGTISNYTAWHGIDPRRFTTHYFRTPVSKLLQQKEARFVKQGKWDGRTVSIVDTKPTKANRKYRFWIDTERMIVVRRAALIRYAADQKWQEYTRVESSKHKEIAVGLWLPMHVKYESVSVTKEQKPEQLSWSYEGTNSDWKVNQKLPDSQFKIVFPAGVRVTDARPREKKPKPGSSDKKTAGKTAQVEPKSAELREFLDRIATNKRGNRVTKRNRHRQSADGKITSLDLRGLKPPKLKSSDFRIIAGLKHLRVLNLYESSVNDDDLSQLSKLSSLRELILNWTKISGKGLAPLKNLRQLQVLELRLTKIKDEDAAVIRGFTNLRRLKISDTAIGNASLKQFTQLKKLEVLKLGGTRITDAGLKHLMGHTQLQGVTLEETAITPAGLRDLARHAQFKWIATPRDTVKEYIRRAQASDFDGIERMTSPGVYLPDRGDYKLLKQKALPRTARDKKLDRQRYYLEFDWIQPSGKNDKIHITLSVDRGTIGGHEVGIGSADDK